MFSAFKNSSIEYLGKPQFALTFLLAVILHFMGLIGWSMMPSMRIVDIPVRAINIRLGDSDVQQFVDDEVAPQPETDTSDDVEDAMAKLIRKTPDPKIAKKTPQVVEKPPQDVPDKVAPKRITVNDRLDTPRQYVRFTQPTKMDESIDGSILGNSKDSKADVKSRYEQTISLWIQKFKLYPENARSQGIKGKTVVRIRIDRRGNVRYSSLEDTTGNLELDHAALDMVRRANPVPAVPDTYPDGEMFEFLIPVNFNIH